jgi:hypothetical protein
MDETTLPVLLNVDLSTAASYRRLNPVRDRIETGRDKSSPGLEAITHAGGVEVHPKRWTKAEFGLESRVIDRRESPQKCSIISGPASLLSQVTTQCAVIKRQSNIGHILGCRRGVFLHVEKAKQKTSKATHTKGMPEHLDTFDSADHCHHE